MTVFRRLVVLVLAGLLAACGGGGGPQDTAEPRSAPTSAAGSPAGPDGESAREPTAGPPVPSESQPAPDPPADAPLAPGLGFALPAVGGGQVVGAELAGRDVALWFWAPW